MKTQHTPGPWKLAQGTTCIENAYGGLIARVFVESAACDADARLIAAAPDLLAALHAFNDAYSFISEKAPAPLQHAVRKARAAIAKAKGESK